MSSILEDLRLDGLSLNSHGDDRTNYATNPSFRESISGWLVYQNVGTGTLTHLPAAAGADGELGVAKLTATSAITSLGVMMDPGSPIAVVAGEQWTMTAYSAPNTTGRQFTMLAAFYTAGGALVSSTGGTTKLNVLGTWTRANDFTVTIPPTAAKMTVYVSHNAVANGEIHYVSDVLVERGTSAGTYFDGDIAGYAWAGTPYASISASSPYSLEALSMPVPPALAEWVKGADSNGAILAREPLHENRVIEARIRVNQQASMDDALAAIGVLLDRLQECARQDDGRPLEWVPAEATTDPLTFRCLQGEITDLPIDWQDSGWFVRSPALTVRMTCLPFGLEAEQQIATVTSSAPIIPLELDDIPGDVPALGRLVVTDAATQSRRYVAWGLESKDYDDTTSLVIDTFVTTGYAGVLSGGSVQATLHPQAQAICGLGNLTHVGSFRPQLRVYTQGPQAFRLTFQALDGPARSLSYKIPVVDEGWNSIDLGLITIPEATLGAQRWTGRIEAYATTSAAAAIYVHRIWLMPAELYGRARAVQPSQPGVMTGYDYYTATTAGANLNARAAPAGGSWATSGAATDFQFADATSVTGETVQRSTLSDASLRFAILGSTNYTNTDARARLLISGGSPSNVVIARWVDSSNYARVTVGFGTITAAVTIAGSLTTLVSMNYTLVPNTPYVLQIVVYASGQGRASLLDNNGATLASKPFYHAALATGGVLATGKPGFADGNFSGGASTRYYEDFFAVTPPAEAMVCYSGQSIEFRDDETKREDATGVYAGDAPEAIGAWFTVPNDGGPGRKSRVAVLARRNDVETAADNDLPGTTMDSTTVTVFATPQYLVVPR